MDTLNKKLYNTKVITFLLEATPGFEPGIRVLQTRALATWLCRHILFGILEQVVGIEPATKPWQGFILPLNYTCVHYIILSSI